MAQGRRTWPVPTDARGWSSVVAGGQLEQCPPGTVVAALRALLTRADRRLLDALAAHLSLVIIRRLRRIVGRHHANAGEDAVIEAHDALLEAICDPASLDGAEIVENFGPRLRFRAVDAIRVDLRYHRRHPPYALDEDGEPMLPGSLASAGSIAVEHALVVIQDPRKRLAFRLRMEGMRVGRGDPCVASVLCVDPKTAATWIAEAKATLAAHMTKGA